MYTIILNKLKNIITIGIRSDVLKVLAMILMLIDHIGSITGNIALRGIGRLAFPLFVYLSVKSLYYTSNKRKYLFNLLIFAFISELPYDLLLHTVNKGLPVFNMKSQNVFFTFVVGIMAIELYEKLQHLSYIEKFLKMLLICIFLGIIAEVIFRSDYGFYGVVTFGIIYLFKDNKLLLISITPIFIMSTYVLYQISINPENCSRNIFLTLPMLLAYPLMALDNNKRTKNKIFKWCGYWFYPLHQLILALI